MTPSGKKAKRGGKPTPSGNVVDRIVTETDVSLILGGDNLDR